MCNPVVIFALCGLAFVVVTLIAATSQPREQPFDQEPLRPPLQPPHRRHAAAVPNVLKNRLKGRKPRQETAERPLTIPVSKAGWRRRPGGR